MRNACLLYLAAKRDCMLRAFAEKTRAGRGWQAEKVLTRHRSRGNARSSSKSWRKQQVRARAGKIKDHNAIYSIDSRLKLDEEKNISTSRLAKHSCLL
jgi:hypothetical protein